MKTPLNHILLGYSACLLPRVKAFRQANTWHETVCRLDQPMHEFYSNLSYYSFLYNGYPHETDLQFAENLGSY